MNDPFLFKQWGEWAPWDGDCYELPAGCDDTVAEERSTHPFGRDLPFLCVGKRAAGRTLDGRTHDGFPSRDQAKCAASRPTTQLGICAKILKIMESEPSKFWTFLDVALSLKGISSQAMIEAMRELLTHGVIEAQEQEGTQSFRLRPSGAGPTGYPS